MPGAPLAYAGADLCVWLPRIAAGRGWRELDPAGSGATHQRRLRSNQHAPALRPCYSDWLKPALAYARRGGLMEL